MSSTLVVMSDPATLMESLIKTCGDQNSQELLYVRFCEALSGRSLIAEGIVRALQFALFDYIQACALTIEGVKALNAQMEHYIRAVTPDVIVDETLVYWESVQSEYLGSWS